MGEKEVMAILEKIGMEDKLKLLSETDKAYVRGYIDRAFLEQRAKAPTKHEKAKGTNK
jgi:hypothetical protein